MENITKTSMCITVDKETLGKFRVYCKQHGMKMSTVINNKMAELVKEIKMPPLPTR